MLWTNATPSDYPEFSQFLVKQGIDSVSVTPDAVFKTINIVLTAEQNISAQKQLSLGLSR